MKILVTGGGGFLGKHLVKNLLENRHQVIIFDDFSNSKKESINHFESMGAKIIVGDITKPKKLNEATRDQDIIIHLAAMISVEESIKNPTKVLQINVEGTKNILESCRKNNIKKIIAASSAAVYGESFPNQKLKEDTKLNPISPYGKSKLLMEQEITKFALEHKIDYVILRLFNIFGIGQSNEYAGVITKFIKKINENKQLEIFGDGRQTRDFISVSDIVNSINNAILSKNNGIFNIASGKSITIKELAKTMIFLSGKKLRIKYLPWKKGDIKFSQADISLAKDKLQYSPKFGLEEIKNLLG